jgi:hypothetical protein
VKLTPSAVEFVPGGMNSSSTIAESSATGGMSASANEWKPPTAGDASFVADESNAVPSYVEVNYGADSFYVPDDLAETYQSTMPGVLPTPEDETALSTIDWNTGEQHFTNNIIAS